MHSSVIEWVGAMVNLYSLSTIRTLELGSRDLNGSVRPMFDGEYVGVDLVKGPGVDLVMDGAALDFPDSHFDLVVSTSHLEHDRTFWLTLREVARVLRPGGFFILTSVADFHIHNRPDYWRFLPDTWPLLMGMAECELLNSRDDPKHAGPQLLGRRREA